MGLIRKVIAAGVVKKIYDEARKPENQRRIKDAIASVQAKRKGTSGGPRPL